MNRYTSHDGENYPSSERRNWTLVISGACKPGISPADDRPRANCRRMQFAHRVGKPVEDPPGARLSVAARLSVRDDRAARLPASAPKHRRTPHCRARARVQTRTHTYVRRYVAVGRARTSVRARRIAPARGWHPGEFSCYVRGTSGEEKDEGEKGRKAERRFSRGTKGNETGDPCVARRRRRAASIRRRILTHAQNTQAYPRTYASKPHATTPSQSDVGSGPTIHPDGTLSLLRTDVSHGYATRLHGGPREGDTRWD